MTRQSTVIGDTFYFGPGSSAPSGDEDESDGERSSLPWCLTAWSPSSEQVRSLSNRDLIVAAEMFEPAGIERDDGGISQPRFRETVTKAEQQNQQMQQVLNSESDRFVVVPDDSDRTWLNLFREILARYHANPELIMSSERCRRYAIWGYEVGELDHRWIEILDGPSGGFVMHLVRRPAAMMSSHLLFVSEGNVAIGDCEDIADESQLEEPVSSALSCCRIARPYRPTIDRLENYEPLGNWSSYDLIEAFQRMEPHEGTAVLDREVVPTEPAHMAIALALFREIAVRVSQNDARILGNLWGNWRYWRDAGDELRALGAEGDAGDAGDEVRALGGEGVAGVVHRRIDLAEITRLVQARLMKERETSAETSADPTVPEEPR